MPLVHQPNLGYPDYQRVGNYDTGALFSTSPVGDAALITSGVVNVSRFAYLALFANITGSPGACTVLINWYLDSDATVPVGSRSFNLEPHIPIAQVKLVNLGPFVIIEIAPYPATLTGFFDVYATNRVYALEFIPQNAVLVDDQSVAINASAVSQRYPAGYYAGPIGVGFFAGIANLNVQLQYFNAAGAWDTLGEIQTTASGWNYDVMVAPMGAWRMTVANNAASNSSYFLAVTPSTTGAT